MSSLQTSLAKSHGVEVGPEGMSALDAKRAAAVIARKRAEERVEQVTREMSFGGRGRRGGSGRGRGGPRGSGRGSSRGGGRGRGSYFTKHQSFTDTNSKNTSGNTSVPVCRYFRQGRCNAGIRCKFRHTQEAAMEGARFKAQRSSSLPSKTYCPYIALAISKAKEAQDNEPLPLYATDDTDQGPYFSIDVECVATGYGHTTTSNNRIPGRVALVDSDGNTLLDEYVKFSPEQTPQIVSYLTPLTGITAQNCSGEDAKTLPEIVQLIRDKIPKESIIVGQSIKHDLEWLGLTHEDDYRDAIDISTIFRQRVPRNVQEAAEILKAQDGGNNDNADQPQQKPLSKEQHTDEDLGFPTKYRIFSLRHACIHLLNEDPQQSHHDPTLDAKYSLVLFQKYKSAPAPQLRAIRDALHRAPVTNSFSYECPIIDGVCMASTSYKYKWAGRFIWKWYTSHRHSSSSSS